MNSVTFKYSQMRPIFFFLLSLQYKVFHIRNLHAPGVHSSLHPGIPFGIFETLKCRFQKEFKTGTMDPAHQSD
jgi:hypothetical protein